jgi:hypothetical protein
MKAKIYKLNTGGNCIISFRYAEKRDNVGRDIIKVWDNWTGNKPVYVSVSKYVQSFELGDGSKFYLSEFK